ncbi:MAG: hypothetical protein GY696_34215 [Gammaproteobacteria bacterium]|nr:hypothetical protein [Gammaproteobacteria bacterium]
MSEEKNLTPLNIEALEGPSAAFANFCLAVFEQRSNGDEPFEEADYREAMAMTLRKLQILEDEGVA